MKTYWHIAGAGSGDHCRLTIGYLTLKTAGAHWRRSTRLISCHFEMWAMWAIGQRNLNRSTPFVQCFICSAVYVHMYRYTVLYKVIYKVDFWWPTLPTNAESLALARLLVWAMWVKNIAHTIAHIAHNCHNYHTNLLGYIKDSFTASIFMVF